MINPFVPEVTKYGYLVTQEFPFRREMVNNRSKIETMVVMYSCEHMTKSGKMNNLYKWSLAAP
jgi:hypothetical protein